MNFPEPFASQREEMRRHLGGGWTTYSKDLDLMLHLKWLGFQPKSIYDIGSSNSVWSVMANLVFPDAELQMFEPLAEISEAYRSSREINPVVARFMENARYQIHPVALGSKSGTCLLQWGEGGDEASSSSLRIKKNSDAKVVEVPVYRLDDYAKAGKLDLPDLMKLDTQGSEMEIFAGATEALRAASVIFIECWLTRGYGPKTPLFLEVANHLSGFGFDLFAIGDEYRAPNGVVASKDAVFIKRDLPLNPNPPFQSQI